MGQNQYNRSNDNDRIPEPEKNLFQRIGHHVTVLKEDVSDFRKRRRKKKQMRAEIRAENREERIRARAEKRQKKEAKKAERSDPPPVQNVYGEDDLTSDRNRVSADRIFRDSPTGKRVRRVELTARFGWYIALLVFAFFFTQILQSKMSNIFIGFVFFLPFALLLYTLTAILSLRVDLGSEGATVRKGEPYTYEMRLINQSFLAYPFIEARMILPQSNSVRCTMRSVFLSMAPFGDYDMKNEVRFRFRGTYHIGVECFYVYDFFRIFRVRVDIRNAATVTVLPRKLLMEDGFGYTPGDSAEVKRKIASVDKVEVEDIRDYFPGDPLKSIHWNLSSRSEDLIVKEYDSGSTKVTYIYCDLAARFPEEPPAPIIDPNAQKRALRMEKSRLKKREKLLLAAKKRGDTISEEELALLLRTPAEQKRDRDQSRDASARKKELKRIATTAKKDPEKAARMRDRLYDKTRLQDAGKRNAEDPDRKTAVYADTEIHLLREERFYEDMNEYCADGVIELTIAAAFRELRRGNDVVLLWYDDRAASGMCAYALRDPMELEAVASVFATAPLTDRDRFVGNLSRVAEDASGLKQIFVTASIDRETVAAFSTLPNVADGSGNEILLYSPDARFLHVEQRNAYIEGCREELQQSGFVLVKETPAQKRTGMEVKVHEA